MEAGVRRDEGEPGARRLKELERENGRLKRAVADLTLDKLILEEAAERTVSESSNLPSQPWIWTFPPPIRRAVCWAARSVASWVRSPLSDLARPLFSAAKSLPRFTT